MINTKKRLSTVLFVQNCYCRTLKGADLKPTKPLSKPNRPSKQPTFLHPMLSREGSSNGSKRVDPRWQWSAPTEWNRSSINCRTPSVQGGERETSVSEGGGASDQTRLVFFVFPIESLIHISECSRFSFIVFQTKSTQFSRYSSKSQIKSASPQTFKMDNLMKVRLPRDLRDNWIRLQIFRRWHRENLLF